MTENKYRWHDLRKNPDDLPEKALSDFGCSWSEAVLIYGKNTYTGDGSYGLTEYCYETSEGESGWCDVWDIAGSKINPILAWRYIEPFEKGEDDEEH